MNKTIRREILVSTTNTLLANTETSQLVKQELCMLLESVLLTGNSYAGYRNLELVRTPDGYYAPAAGTEYSRLYF